MNQIDVDPLPPLTLAERVILKRRFWKGRASWPSARLTSLVERGLLRECARNGDEVVHIATNVGRLAMSPWRWMVSFPKRRVRKIFFRPGWRTGTNAVIYLECGHRTLRPACKAPKPTGSVDCTFCWSEAMPPTAEGRAAALAAAAR